MKRHAYAITLLLLSTFAVYQYVEYEQRIAYRESQISSLESELEELKEKIEDANEEISRYNDTLIDIWSSRSYKDLYMAARDLSVIDEINTH